MQLNLKKQTAKVAHLNVREEKHGEESVLAVDVKIKADVGNEFLDILSPGLRLALYAPEGEQLEGVEKPFNILRFPQLKPMDWEVLLTGAEFTVHGAKKIDDLVLTGDVAKPIIISPKEGGTVEVTIQVQVLPSSGELATLGEFLGKSTKVSLRPVEQAAQPPIE